MRLTPVFPGRQRGLSIVELMIALALGALLTLGMVQIFTSNSQSFRINDANARAQEAGRIGADILSRALRNAGFYGCFPAQALVNNLNTKDPDYDAKLHVFRPEGLSAENDLKPAAAVAGTDFFVVFGARSDGVSIAASEQVNAASFKVTSSSGLQAGDIVVISDCVNGDIFEVSNIQGGGGGGGSITLVANGGNGKPGNDFSGNSPPGCSNPNNCLSAIYPEGARIMRTYNEAYYIAQGASGNNALFMRNSSGNAIELVDGVTDMRVRYSSDGAAWTNAAGVLDWGSVRAVQVSLLVQAGADNLTPEPSQYCFPGWENCDGVDADMTEAADNRLYRVYTFTVTLRNRTGA